MAQFVHCDVTAMLMRDGATGVPKSAMHATVEGGKQVVDKANGAMLAVRAQHAVSRVRARRSWRAHEQPLCSRVCTRGAAHRRTRDRLRR